MAISRGALKGSDFWGVDFGNSVTGEADLAAHASLGLYRFMGRRRRHVAAAFFFGA
jgi:hypothetical protein